MKLFVKVMLIQDMAATFGLIERRIVVSERFETCSYSAIFSIVPICLARLGDFGMMLGVFAWGGRLRARGDDATLRALGQESVEIPIRRYAALLILTNLLQAPKVHNNTR